MKTRDIVIGVVVLAALAGLILRFRSTRSQKVQTSPSPTPSVEEKLEESFNVQIPENVEKVELKDVSGGNGTGIATRDVENGQSSYMILGDLPTPEQGSYYQGWLQKGQEGSEDYALVSMGNLTLAKGGYLLEYKTSKDLQGYNEVVVSEQTAAVSNIQKAVLEGSFE